MMTNKNEDLRVIILETVRLPLTCSHVLTHAGQQLCALERLSHKVVGATCQAIHHRTPILGVPAGDQDDGDLRGGGGPR